MQDLFQALKMLQDGVKDFAVGRAIDTANEDVRKLKESYVDEHQRVTGLRDIAQNLTMRLSSMKADPNQVKQASEAVYSKPSPIQNALQGMLAGYEDDPAKVREVSENYVDKTNQIKQLGALRKQELADEKEGRRRYDASLKNFGTTAKTYLEAMRTSKLAPDEIVGNVERQTAIRGLIRSSGDTRISYEDVKDFVPNTDVFSKVERAWDAWIKNQVLPEDKDVLDALLKTAQRKTEKLVKKRAQGYSKVEARKLGRDPQEFYEELLQYHAGEVEDVGTPISAPAGSNKYFKPKGK